MSDAPTSAPKSHRGAIERRVWRLAYLISGDAAGAARLADRIFRARIDLDALDAARLDRVIIQRAREIRASKKKAADAQAAAAVKPEGDAAELLRTVRELPEQPREAWVLARVDGLDELHVSRAMDCSKTAARNHLHAAEERVMARYGPRLQQMVDELRKFADGLDPGRIIVEQRMLRRKEARKRALVIGGVAFIIVAGAAVLAMKLLAP
jgi:DNA-directed RNA polymerase specialized sigma24 family protein